VGFKEGHLVIIKRLSPKWIRFLLAVVLVSGNSYSLLTPIAIKAISGVIFVLAVGFLLVTLICIVPHFAKNFYRVLRGTQWQKITPEFMLLAQDMGVKLDKKRPTGIAPNWVNAAATPNNRIIIGKPLLDNLDNLALRGLFAHELTHLKKKHHLKHCVLAVSVTFGVGLYQSFFPSLSDVMACILALAAISLIFSFVSWHFEYEADAIASQYVGKEIMISTLQGIQRMINRHGDTFTHPSFSKRIARLQEIC